MNLLVVEKDPQLYKIWAIQLERLGYDFALAPDCEGAYQAITSNCLPDAIIVDCPLIDAEGRSVVEHLQGVDPLCQMLRYLVTGNPDVEHNNDIEMAFDGVFIKPMDVKHILGVIDQDVAKLSRSAS